MIHGFNGLAQLLKSVAKRAVVEPIVEFFLVVQPEIVFLKARGGKETILVFVAPLVENRTHNAHRVGICIGINADKIGVGEALLLLGPRGNIVFHERLSEVRNHRPVQVSGRNTAKLVQALQLKDDRHQLHGRVQRACRPNVPLPCVETF